jgi:hypothetical protein
MYAGNAALLAESLEVVQRTSAVILGAITVEASGTQDAPMESSQTEATAEPASEPKRARRSRQQPETIAEVA